MPRQPNANIFHVGPLPDDLRKLFTERYPHKLHIVEIPYDPESTADVDYQAAKMYAVVSAIHGTAASMNLFFDTILVLPRPLAAMALFLEMIGRGDYPRARVWMLEAGVDGEPMSADHIIMSSRREGRI